MKTYFDELCSRDDPTSQASRTEMKVKCQTFIQYSDFAGSLEDAFNLWDAVGVSGCASVKKVLLILL